MIVKDKGNRKMRNIARKGLEEEDERKWCTAHEDAAKKALKYLVDSEDVKVGPSELKEHLETLEEACISIMQIAKQARNERGQKLFQIFRQEENEVYIASLARSDTQLEGLVELEMAGLVEDKSRLQSEATEKYYETIFEEMRELAEKKVERSFRTRTERAHSVTHGPMRRMLFVVFDLGGDAQNSSRRSTSGCRTR